jgi:hypothetical protein
VNAPQIFGLLAKAMAAVGVVGKERRNPQQGYAFRGIDDVCAAVQPVFAELGIVVVPQVVEREREEFKTAKGATMFSVRLLVDHHFYAPDGSSVTVRTLGEGMDSGDKATNKAMSAALKYALVELLVIPTYERDRDTEEASPEVHGRAAPQAARQHQAPPRPAPTAREPGADDEPESLEAEIGLCKTVDDVKRLGQAIPKGHALRPRLEARYRELTAGTKERAA